jgi:hypothetical protein
MIDFQPWDRLLRQYVDQHGRVDYLAWKTEQPQVLMILIPLLDENYCLLNFGIKSFF